MSSGPDPAGEEQSGHSTIETLLAVQDLDTTIAQLLHQRAHLPERTAEAAERAAVDTATKGLALVAERRRAIADAQSGLERSLRELDARAADLAAKLPRTMVVREAEALIAEQQVVRDRAGAVEDEELALLEEDDSLDGEEAAQRAERASADERLARAVDVREQAEAVVDEELARRRAERDAVAAPVPSEFLARYDDLRVRMGGVAVARLVGGRCDGCHLALAQAALERIRRAAPDELVECEECGRLLAR